MNICKYSCVLCGFHTIFYYHVQHCSLRCGNIKPFSSIFPHCANNGYDNNCLVLTQGILMRELVKALNLYIYAAHIKNRTQNVKLYLTWNVNMYFWISYQTFPQIWSYIIHIFTEHWTHTAMYNVHEHHRVQRTQIKHRLANWWNMLTDNWFCMN